MRSSSSPGTAGSRRAEVARRAIQLAAEAAPRKRARQDRTAHVGFYLIDKGRTPLGRAVQGALALADHCSNEASTAFRWRFMPAGSAVLTLAGNACGLLAQPARARSCRLASSPSSLLVFLLCASQLAVALMNWLSTLLVKPRLLPRLDYSAGIPADCRTMVVVPTHAHERGRSWIA